MSFGFLAVSNAKELVATIRGTDTILEWLHDGSFLMVSCPVAGAHGFTEDGFAAVYRSLRIGQGNGTLSAKDSIDKVLGDGHAFNREIVLCDRCRIARYAQAFRRRGRVASPPPLCRITRARPLFERLET